MPRDHFSPKNFSRDLVQLFSKKDRFFWRFFHHDFLREKVLDYDGPGTCLMNILVFIFLHNLI
jgi:hypothetical protein